jgi:hypothetical protein
MHWAGRSYFLGDTLSLSFASARCCIYTLLRVSFHVTLHSFVTFQSTVPSFVNDTHSLFLQFCYLSQYLIFHICIRQRCARSLKNERLTYTRPTHIMRISLAANQSPQSTLHSLRLFPSLAYVPANGAGFLRYDKVWRRADGGRLRLSGAAIQTHP